MKSLYSITVAALLLFTTPKVMAHSGGLDSDGGHHNRKTGGYHYHRGVRGNMNWIILGGAAIVFFLLKSKGNRK
ncbi:YHYH domain-containing protein [Hymenobacter sp. DG01]|uniref:YHYH domain-containing protein n=1 Tax=Hymenobacter sp. DG01 TaxID=2584940 RepID=UPI001122CCE9|nr:YHYH domain-containing protein [Hymenobacter sp. DG01]